MCNWIAFSGSISLIEDVLRIEDIANRARLSVSSEFADGENISTAQLFHVVENSVYLPDLTWQSIFCIRNVLWMGPLFIGRKILQIERHQLFPQELREEENAQDHLILPTEKHLFVGKISWQTRFLAFIFTN
jgi:hypothetical protein